MSSIGSSCFEMSFVLYMKFYNVCSIDNCTDVYWLPRDILQGERVDMGHYWEHICIGLFHVSGHCDHFRRHLFLVKKNNDKFGGIFHPLTLQNILR